MTTAESPSAETSPQSVWKCSLVWADLLIGLHVESLEQLRHGQLFKFSEEETALYTGLDRPLVSFLIAAALHERILGLDLSFPDAVFVPLAAPYEEVHRLAADGTPAMTLGGAKLSPGTLAGQIAVLRTMKEFGVRRAMSCWCAKHRTAS